MPVGRGVRLVMAAALAVALGLLVTTSRQRDPRPLHTAEYLRVGSDSLRMVRAGHGPLLLLLHGYGESLLSWRGVFDRLAERFEVVAVDLPGFGLSSKPPTGYTTEDLARTVAQLLDGLGSTRATLIGHSLGGAVAVAFATTHPDRVSGLVLLSPAIVSGPWMTLARGEPASAEMARTLIAEYESLRPVFTSIHDPSWLAESDSAMGYSPGRDSAYRLAVQALLVEFDFSFLDSAGALAVSAPTLILWGAYDRVVTIEHGRRLAAALPSARLEVVDRTWHRPHVERPDTVASVIERFLKSL